MDYTCCICLDHFSPDERRRLEEELELSQTVQRALLPQQVPAIPGVDIAAFSRPAQIVGGDYFDFARFQDGTESLVIADVAGHGMASSMLMASVQTAFRTLTPASHSPADVLERLNHYFTHNINFTTYVTMYLGRFDPKNGKLSYANAGHNPPLVYHKRGGGESSASWLKPTAPSIGLVEGFQATETTIQMEPGDVMLLYTDGITESLSPQGEEFGQERLEDFLFGEAHLTAQEIVQALLQKLRSFTGSAPFVDDVTIVAWKVE
jgi:sigma-B regulation protein RsbU (phosphoserine phosphatase)